MLVNCVNEILINKSNFHRFSNIYIYQTKQARNDLDRIIDMNFKNIKILSFNKLFDTYDDNSNQVIPSLLDWRILKSSDSFFNTLPIFNIYITEKILKYYKKIGGIRKIESKSKEKAELFYSFLEENLDFYQPIVEDNNKRS